MAGSSSLPARLDEALARQARLHGHRVCLVADRRRVTFSELDEAADRVAAALGEAVRVAVRLSDPFWFAASLFGISRAGGSAVLVDPTLPDTDIEDALNDAGAVVAIAEPGLGTLGLRTLTVNMFAANRTAELARAPTGPEEAIIIFTSATSGRPKGVRHSHAALLAHVESLEGLRKEFFGGDLRALLGRLAHFGRAYGTRLLRGLGPQVFLCTLRPYTIAGLAVWLNSILGGHRLVVTEPLAATAILQAIGHEHVTVLAIASPTLELILQAYDPDCHNTRSLLVVGLGGGPIGPELAHRAGSLLSCAVVIGYGMTEMGGAVSVTRVDDPRSKQVTTVGKALWGANVRVVDTNGLPLAAGEAGEIWCRGKTAMLGYVRSSDRARQIVDDEGVTWFDTGDIGIIDEDGYLSVLGRSDDIIIRGDRKIAPEWIEAAITDHPRVKAAAVVGLPTALGGQRVAAFVVTQDGGALRLRDLVRHLRSRLPSHMIPDEVHTVGELPLTGDGKVRRALLRKSVGHLQQ